MYSRAYLDITEAPWKRKKKRIFFSADLEKVPPFVLLILQFNICIWKIFHVLENFWHLDFFSGVITFGNSLSLRNLYCFCPSLINSLDVIVRSQYFLFLFHFYCIYLEINSHRCHCQWIVSIFIRFTLKGLQQPGWPALCKPATMC